VKNSKEFKKINIAGTVPALIDGEVAVTEVSAICKYLARVGPEGADLLGSSILEQAQVEQLLSYTFSQISPNIACIAHATFGFMMPFQDEYNDAFKSLKEQLKGINNRLAKGDRTWLVGDHCTVADIYLAGLLTSSFQTCLEQGF